MESNGWSRVRDNSDNLVVRVHLASGKFEICLTDLASLWSISQSSQDILKACQVSSQYHQQISNDFILNNYYGSI